MSRNDAVRQRFLRGERLTSAQVQEEYGGSRSGLQWALRTMQNEGYTFKSKKVEGAGNVREYWLDVEKAKLKSNDDGEPEENLENQENLENRELDITDDRSTMVKLRERLEAGEGLVASEIAQEYDVTPNVLSVTLAQMTKEGFVFEHSSDRTVNTNGKARTLKRHRVVAKHEPMAHRASNGKSTSNGKSATNGRKKKAAAGFRIPAPQVDVLTEVILVHRISDGEIQVGMMQNGHQWLLEVRSYME